MRIACLLALLPAVFAAGRLFVKGEHLPVVSKVRKFEKPTPFGTVLVELDASGHMFVNGSRGTLHQVDAFVLRTTEERAIYLRRKGKPGYDELPSGIKGSNVAVHLRVHREAPWRHVQWLLSIAGAQRAYKTEFVARDRKGEGVVAVWLPFDEAEEGGFEFPEDDADETTRAPRDKKRTLTVTLLAEGKKPIRFAGKPAKGPERIAWAIGKRKTKDREKFLGWLNEAFAAGKKTLEVRAAARVPYHEVLAVVDLARRAGQERIDLYRAEIPSRAVRMLRDLPYPD